MFSMTGFGFGKAAFADGYIALEIKTVNHRFLEVRTKAPRELLAGESLVERLLREALGRGYCLVNLWYEGQLGGSTAIDRGALKTHLDTLIEVGKDRELCLTDLVPVLAGAPDIFTTPRVQDERALEKSIREAFAEALEELLAMRTSEGEAMAEKLKEQYRSLNRRVSKLAELAASWPPIARQRLKDRLEGLIGEPDTKVESGRLEAEVALLASRADVTEETTRLESHLAQLKEVFAADAPVGRKLEFLIQEMGRETNTIAAKTSLAEVAAAVIDIKAELEKMRELAQNIE
jgi:uncharacterized protein (TIGR00255 family)